MNCNILKCLEFRQVIKRLIIEFYTKEAPKLSPFKAYQTIKGRLKWTIHHWCRERAKTLNQKEKKLQVTIDTLQKKLELQDREMSNQSWADQITTAQQELAELLKNKAHGAWVRSRAKWDFDRERSTKWYFNLEKQYQGRKYMHQIFDNKGNTIKPRKGS